MPNLKSTIEASFPGWKTVAIERPGPAQHVVKASPSLSLEDMRALLGAPAQNAVELVPAASANDEVEVVRLRKDAVNGPPLEKSVVLVNGEIAIVQG